MGLPTQAREKGKEAATRDMAKREKPAAGAQAGGAGSSAKAKAVAEVTAAATALKRPCHKGKGIVGAAAQGSGSSKGKEKQPQLAPKAGGSAAAQKRPREKEICVICQDPLHKTKTECKELPCGHTFHRSCLVPWLREHNTCPHCRTVTSACPRGELLMDSTSRAPAPPRFDMPSGLGLFASSLFESLLRGPPPGLALPAGGPAGAPIMMVHGPGGMMMLGVPPFGQFMMGEDEDEYWRDDDDDYMDEEFGDFARMSGDRCDCDGCRERREREGDMALGAGEADDLRACHLCQTLEEEMSSDLRLWSCDKCGYEFCTACRQVELCSLEGCQKQLCSCCGAKSKCKGCKKLASKHRTSQSSQGASSAVGGSAASASTAASSEAKGGKGPKTHSGSGAGSGGRREGGAVSSKDKRAEGI